MRKQVFLLAAAAVLTAGAASAQTLSAPRSDTAPPPAEERNSVGAVVLMDQPVLAQKQAMEQALAAGPDTRSMGAGPARVIRRVLTREELQIFKAQEAADLQRDGASQRAPK